MNRLVLSGALALAMASNAASAQSPNGVRTLDPRGSIYVSDPGRFAALVDRVQTDF